MHAATAPPQKMWAAMPISVVVDVAMQRAYTASGNMLWGAVYQDFLGEQQELVVAGTGAQTLVSGGKHGGRAVLGSAVSVSPGWCSSSCWSGSSPDVRERVSGVTMGPWRRTP